MSNFFRERNINEGLVLVEFGVEETSRNNVTGNFDIGFSRSNFDETLVVESHIEVNGKLTVVGGSRDIVLSAIDSQVTVQSEVNVLRGDNVSVVNLLDAGLFGINLSFLHVELELNGETIPVLIHGSNRDILEIRIELMENHIL